MISSHKLLLSVLTSLTIGFVVACGGTNEEPGGDEPIVTPPATGGAASGGSDGSGGSVEGSGGRFEEPEREACADEADGEQPDSHPASHRGTPCWNVEDCNIVNPEQAKNQCSGSTCVPFDDTGRIEGYAAGDPLPPL